MPHVAFKDAEYAQIQVSPGCKSIYTWDIDHTEWYKVTTLPHIGARGPKIHLVRLIGGRLPGLSMAIHQVEKNNAARRLDIIEISDDDDDETGLVSPGSVVFNWSPWNVAYFTVWGALFAGVSSLTSRRQKGKKGGKGKQRCKGLPFEEEEEVGTISSTISASKPPESRRETRPAGSERLRAEVNARAFALPEGRRGVLTYSAIFHPYFQDVAKRMTFQIEQPKDGESTNGPLERDTTRGLVLISPRNNDRSNIREMLEAYGNEMVYGDVHVTSDWTSDACPKGTRGLCVGKGRTNSEASEEFWASFTTSYALDVQRKGQKPNEAALHQAQKRLPNWVEYGTPFSKRRRDDDDGDVEYGADVEARAIKRRREYHERSQGGSESHVETDGEDKMEYDD
ncbi:uncharacterized protein BXZ73DRAFT_82078 [Epithele typhae]|uniref:uncharacterized protein n=1 Tax=Epithele typhae TaxID=378194 RepID=UPI002007EBE0|nr:uncharacterized protein BXZ73DRAFT_82078 [Epithele typhae]KAH9912990.1 hypothetical protein BXZ73DRAFT_82078 [Epithele typhae]